MNSAADRRVEVVLQNVAADVEDVERARAGRHQVRALQAVRRLGEGIAGRGQQAAARHAELARQRRQRRNGADAGAAVAVALQPVAITDRRRRRVLVPVGERADVGFRHAADFGRALRRPFPGARHELVEARDVGRDEIVVEPTDTFELRRHRPGQNHVGARPDRQVKVGLLRHLDALGVDDDHPRPVAARGVDA